MMEARNNILMISGASPNAGKTFVSSNLAAIISQTGKTVLFIDTDMRKGYTHKLFNLDNSNGLPIFLQGKFQLLMRLKVLRMQDFIIYLEGLYRQIQRNF